MKLYSKILFGCILILTVWGMNACGEEQTYFRDLTESSETAARLKFIHAASDVDAVVVTIDGEAVSSAEGVSYPEEFPQTGYSVVDPGTRTIAFTTVDGVELSSKSVDLSESEYMTVFLSGEVGTYEIVTLEDVQQEYDGATYIRFANMLDNFDNNVTFKVTTSEDITSVLLQNYEFKQGIATFTLMEAGSYSEIAIYDATMDTLMANASSSTLTAYKVMTYYAATEFDLDADGNDIEVVSLETAVNR